MVKKKDQKNQQHKSGKKIFLFEEPIINSKLHLLIYITHVTLSPWFCRTVVLYAMLILN